MLSLSFLSNDSSSMMVGILVILESSKRLGVALLVGSGDGNRPFKLNDCLGLVDCTSLIELGGEFGLYGLSFLAILGGDGVTPVALGLDCFFLLWDFFVGGAEVDVTVDVTVMSDAEGSILKYFSRRSK